MCDRAATQHVATAFVPGFPRRAPLPAVVLENGRAKVKKGEYSARSVEIRSSANERRPCAPVGLRDRSRLRRRSASLRSPAGCKTSKFLRLQISSTPKFLRLQCQTFPNFSGSNAIQRFLWRLCGISKGCVGSKPGKSTLQIFVLQTGLKKPSGPPNQCGRL